MSQLYHTSDDNEFKKGSVGHSRLYMELKRWHKTTGKIKAEIGKQLEKATR